MTRLGLRPYGAGDAPPPRAVPVTVVVLTRDEEVNLARCLTSVQWADQVIVVDSGSADGTVALARSLGAEVVHQPWLGFSGQREFALRLLEVRNDWVYFVDADEWVSPQLAAEVSAALAATGCAAFSHRLRLVFLGTWIRHCGWYSGSRVVRLVDRRYTKYDGSLVGERARVDGPVGRLANDIVDEDLKGLAPWLHKHVRYAELEQRRRGQPVPLRARLGRFRHRDRTDTRPLARVVMKDLIFPAVPARPLALFLYMYVVRLGFLDGRAGLRFCFFHAWYQAAVDGLRAESLLPSREHPAVTRSTLCPSLSAGRVRRGGAALVSPRPRPGSGCLLPTPSSTRRRCTGSSPGAARWTWRWPTSAGRERARFTTPASASPSPGTSTCSAGTAQPS